MSDYTRLMNLHDRRVRNGNHDAPKYIVESVTAIRALADRMGVFDRAIGGPPTYKDFRRWWDSWIEPELRAIEGKAPYADD